ncbi:O-antigen ligase family protein [Alishewanella sp. d11]|uniref:O-antigen ligase family protein n=1 Tax=Alishewanella sp. d11 TaxID=3414030 RepID=UPI003BF92802
MVGKLALTPFSVMLWLLGFIMVWAPVPLASNRIWAWSILHLLIGAAALLHCYFAFRHNLPWFRAPWLRGFLAVPLLVGLYMGLQSLNLLPGVSSATPYHSQLLAVRTFYLLLYLWLLCTYLHSVSAMRFFMVAIVLSGVLQATYGAVIHLAGFELSPIFGVNEAGRARGSFVYQNHFANYLALCISMAIGWIICELNNEKRALSLKARLRELVSVLLSPKMLLRLAVVIMIIALILSRSRMGNSGFFVALGITALLAIFFYKKPPTLLKPLVISVFILDLIIVGAIFGVEKVKERIQETSLAAETRDEVVLDSMPVLKEHWLTGTGAGSFYAVFPAHQQSAYSGFYDHAHNEYVQFVFELGLPITLLLGAWQLYALWLCLQTMRKRKTRFYQGVAFGAMMANIHMLVHNTVDFNLQSPANTLLFVSILALSHLAWHNESPKRLRTRQASFS